MVHGLQWQSAVVGQIRRRQCRSGSEAYGEVVFTSWNYATAVVGATSTSPTFDWNAPYIPPQAAAEVSLLGVVVWCIFFCIPTPLPVI